MKKLLLLLSILLSLASRAQYVTIPDANFVSYLKSNGFSQCFLNGTNQMDTTCQAVVKATYMGCSSNNISDLTGIQYFDRLQSLSCYGNQLSILPRLPNGLIDLRCFSNQLWILSGLPAGLQSLDCSYNPLISLFPIPTSLQYLDCRSSQLGGLPDLPAGLQTIFCANSQIKELPDLPSALQNLDCSNNQLSRLPLLPLGLKGIDCHNNGLSSLPDLPNGLQQIDCSFNQLTSLFALPVSLKLLFCGYNQLISLPILPDSLRYLQCYYNQLTSIPELPNYMDRFYCNNNPYLFCLPELKRIDNLDFSYTSVTCLPDYGNVTNSNPPLSSIPLCTIFNSNGCSSFFNINGEVFFDKNNNCQVDTNDAGAKNIKLLLWSGGILKQQTITTQGGGYSFKTDSFGMYDVIVDTFNIPFIVSCPVNNLQHDTITALDSLDYSKDFALRCKNGFDLGAWSIAGRFRPSDTRQVNISAGEIANFYGVHCAHGVSGSVVVTIAGPASFASPASGALSPSNVNGNVITWNIPDFGTTNFTTDFNIIVRTDTTAQSGQQVCFTVSVTPTVGDNNPANNTLSQCFTVRASYDPNEKEVYPSGSTDISQKWLTYTIHFQNTGTASAEHIYVLDTLSSYLDAGTFQLLAYSHKNITQILEGGIVKFNFPNINLPDSNHNEPLSHGYVQYKIKLKDNLPLGTKIQNTAHIVFDFNPAIKTNTVTNLLCQPDTSFIYASICTGDSFLFKGTMLRTTGDYLDTSLVNANGCDSLVMLRLTMLPKGSIFSDAVCDGVNYLFHNKILNQSGNYRDTLQNSLGCDSIVMVRLTVIPPGSETSDTICSGTPYMFFDFLLAQTGVYTRKLTNVLGCDSLITLRLKVWPGSATSLNRTICTGQTYYFFGQTLFVPGDYYAALPDIHGCDSTLYLHLNVVSHYSSGFSASVCRGGAYSFKGKNLGAAGDYNDTLKTAGGCDSIVTLHLSVLPYLSSGFSASVCTGKTYPFNGILLDAAGDYRDTLKNLNGCDSIRTLHLSMLQNSFSSLSPVICTGETFYVGNIAHSQRGAYLDTIHSVNGCDSIVTVNLSFIPPEDTTVMVNDSMLTSAAANVNYQWIDCNTRLQVAGADSQSFIPPASGNYAVVITKNNCSDTSSCFSILINGIQPVMERPEIFIYPNPATDELIIHTGGFRPELISVYDVDGRKISEQKFIPRLNIASLSSGIYFIEVKGVNAVGRKRFVKQ